ncbi:MAG: Fe-S oxidoreductase [Paludibacteraceae bacterium]|nr:Fe-S oxidoreductase [Paludibacteraceae bacterium]
MKKLLMIDPAFPHPPKSKNHQNVLPIPLLKIGAMYKDKGWDVMLVRLSESEDPIDYEPDEIKVTSLFTYYSKYVVDAVRWARTHYPDVPIEVGGIWASLMPDKCRELTGADVFVGVCNEAEQYPADYSLLSESIDFQILHTQRGCHRRCKTCGVYCIEPDLEFKDSIKDLVQKPKLVFYDNNLLLNPHIEKILKELILLKRKRIVKSCESQSGFDGRILRNKPYLARMLKEAGFIKPKIAWDGSIKNWEKRKQEVDILKQVYAPKHISVFVLYNYEQPFEDLENKRRYCWDWKVQVTNCRYRPLDALDDLFQGRKKNQTTEDYYIHPNWSDEEVKKYNQNVRRHNMCLRFGTLFHSRKMQYKKISKEMSNFCRYMTPQEASKYLDDVWNPADFHGIGVQNV